MKKILAALLSVVLLFSMAIPSFAEANESPFAPDAYATVVTASDFQRYTNEAFKRFDTILTLAGDMGMPTPESVLIGGDYTMVLNDDAVPGIAKIRGSVLSHYPEMDARSVVCIQGNHDRPKPEITKTGFYDMGAFCLYVINEDDFPWQQNITKPDGVIALAGEMETALKGMVDAGDLRPVMVLTHVPLHHTTRNNGGDNLYSRYVFDVLNKYGETLDIVYLFGHNHSHPLDDYIGGSVNFLSNGDTIRIPDPDNMGKNIYNEETLNFTYTNCGYVGYSKNGTENGSTDVLTMGVVQFTPDSIRVLKFSEKDCFRVNETARKTTTTGRNEPVYPELVDRCLCHSDSTFLRVVFKVFHFFAGIFGENIYCVCGVKH